MTNPRIGIISARLAAGVAPAQTCVMELENVLAETLAATILPVLDRNHREDGARYDHLIVPGISYWQVSRLLQATAGLRSRSGTVHAYVFDAFHRYLSSWIGRFPRPLRGLAGLARHELRSLGRLDGVFMPVRSLIDEQSAFLDVPVLYLPIGVDTRQVAMPMERPIDVNGYGRQPPELSNMLSDTLNRDVTGWYHHTDHMKIAAVTDPIRHRRLFWRTLSASKIALAYASDAYDPLGRFDAAFVGQRWFESMAAGCVVAGRKPSIAETGELFDWPDALIELPDRPKDAVEALAGLLAEPQRLAAIGIRNREEALRLHDWRHRVRVMAAAIGIALPAGRSAPGRVGLDPPPSPLAT